VKHGDGDRQGNKGNCGEGYEKAKNILEKKKDTLEKSSDDPFGKRGHRGGRVEKVDPQRIRKNQKLSDPCKEGASTVRKRSISITETDMNRLQGLLESGIRFGYRDKKISSNWRRVKS